MAKFNYLKLLIILTALLAVVGGPSLVDALAQPTGDGPPPLGTADSFAVLAGSAATNTGSTLVTGNLGVWPGSAVTGFPPGVVIGTIYAGDAVAQQAQSDVTVAYNDLAGRACDDDLTGTDLGGLTLGPGVYCFSTAAQLTGQLTLDAQGNADALFIFQMGSTLITASNSSVVLINSGDECNVFWQVGSSATLGSSTAFAGNILAQTSITANTNAGVSGRTLARNGAVTMDTNAISMAGCDSGGPSPTPTNTPTAGPSPTPTATATFGPSPTPTNTATAGPSPTATATEPATNVDISEFGGNGSGLSIGPWLLFLFAFLGIVAWWMWRNRPSES